MMEMIFKTLGIHFTCSIRKPVYNLISLAFRGFKTSVKSRDLKRDFNPLDIDIPLKLSRNP